MAHGVAHAANAGLIRVMTDVRNPTAAVPAAAGAASADATDTAEAATPVMTAAADATAAGVRAEALPLIAPLQLSAKYNGHQGFRFVEDRKGSRCCC